jgi:hypothetical protein
MRVSIASEVSDLALEETSRPYLKAEKQACLAGISFRKNSYRYW